MIEPLYLVLNNRPLAQGMSANAHIKSYCFTDISLTSKCLWRTCDLPWGFRNYSESKNKKDGGREWRQRHQFTLQWNIIASYFWQEMYKSRDIGMVVDLCSLPSLPFKSIKPEIMIQFGDERHVTETVPLLQPCSPTQTVLTLRNKKAPMYLPAQPYLCWGLTVCQSLGISPFPRNHPTVQPLPSYSNTVGLTPWAFFPPPDPQGLPSLYCPQALPPKVPPHSCLGSELLKHIRKETGDYFLWPDFIKIEQIL